MVNKPFNFTIKKSKYFYHLLDMKYAIYYTHTHTHIHTHTHTHTHIHRRTFPDGSDSKESACNVRDLSSILQSYLQYSCLENSMDRGAW